jgi:hypothetical protein
MVAICEFIAGPFLTSTTSVSHRLCRVPRVSPSVRRKQNKSRRNMSKLPRFKRVLFENRREGFPPGFSDLLHTHGLKSGYYYYTSSR